MIPGKVLKEMVMSYGGGYQLMIASTKSTKVKA